MNPDYIREENLPCRVLVVEEKDLLALRRPVDAARASELICMYPAIKNFKKFRKVNLVEWST